MRPRPAHASRGCPTDCRSPPRRRPSQGDRPPRSPNSGGAARRTTRSSRARAGQSHCVHQVMLRDIHHPAEPGPTTAAGLACVREAAFGVLAALATQAASPRARDALAVRVHHVLLPLRLVHPGAPTALRLGNVRPHVLHLGEGLERVRLVVALVPDHLVHLARAAGRCQLLTRQLHRDRPGLGVRVIAPIDHRRHDQAAAQLHRVFRLVGQVCAPILHLRHPAVRIRRGHPLFVRGLLLARAVESPHLIIARILDPLGLHQPLHVCLPVLVGRPAHQRLHRRVGLQRRRVHRDRLPLEELVRHRHLQHERKHLPEHL